MDDRVNAEITEFVTRTGRRPDEWAPEWESAFNIAPTEDIPILIDSAKTGELRFERARWSLVPAWSPTLKLKFPTFNARAEGMADKSTWRKRAADAPRDRPRPRVLRVDGGEGQ